MQIISYYGNISSAQKEDYAEYKNYRPERRLTGTSKTYRVGSIYSFQGFSSQKETPSKELSIDFSFITSFFKYFFVIAASLALPVWIFFNTEPKTENLAMLSLSPFNSEQMQFLDKAMENFAFNMEGLVDSDGNILDSEGNAIITTPSFREPVEFREYIVKNGDTISGITKSEGLSNVSTLIGINEISNVRSLKSGQKLKIPSMDGLLYSVKEGETLASLSVRYGVTVEDFLDVNDLESQELYTGQKLFVPGAKLDNTTLHSALGDLFMVPLARSYTLSSKFGPRVAPADVKTGRVSIHTGIDMAVPQGTPIRASMAGKIVYAGYSPIYGNYVIIKHGNGYQTLYAHMYKILVSINQSVNQGAQIGLVGSTGYSTGPHLHFGVYKNGKLIDPLSVLNKN